MMREIVDVFGNVIGVAPSTATPNDAAIARRFYDRIWQIRNTSSAPWPTVLDQALAEFRNPPA